MIINTKGVELSENNFLNKEGNFLFRIEKFEEDGFTNNGDHRFKLHFKGIEVGIKEPVYIHSEQFNIGAKSLWRIKQLEVALKAPEIYDINNFIGRYVIAASKKEEYTKNDGTAGVVYRIKSWTYSELNDKMTPIPEAIENKDVSDSKSEPTIEIDDDKIPF